MDHAFPIGQIAGRREQLGIERKFQDVGRLDQLRAARARKQIAAGIGRMADADMTEAVEHALMGDNAVGQRQLIAGFVEGIRHRGSFQRSCCLVDAAQS
jgi:hypothetical protein